MPLNNYSYRDSLGKCDHNSHQYGMSPAYPLPQVNKTLPATRDVLVSSQQKVDMEVLQRFKTEKTTGVVLIAKVGKFFFLIIIFPPYFVVYAFPKWLAVELFPKAFEEFKKGWDKGLALLLNLASWVTFKVSRPFKRAQAIFQVKYRKAQEWIGNFLNRVKKRIETIGRVTKERTLDPIKQFSQRTVQAFSQFLSTGQGNVKQKLENMRSIASKIVKGIAKTSRSLMTPQPVVAFLKSFKQWMDVKSRGVLDVLKNENLRTKAKAEKIVQKIKEALQPRVEASLLKVQEAQQKVVQVFQQMSFQLKELSIPKIKAAWSVIREFNQMLKERVTETLAKFVEWSKLGIQWGKIQLAPAFQMTSNMAQNFLRFLPQVVGSWLLEGKNISVKFLKQLQQTLKFLTLKALSLRHKLVAAAQAFYQFLKRSWERGKNLYREGKNKLKRVIKKGISLSLHLVERGTIWTIRLLLWLRLLLAWIRVLTWYGMGLLPEMTSHILKKIRS